jgi:hypothetical protein
VINLDITRHAVKRLTGHLPTDAAIWHSIRSKDITRMIQVFLWKVLHKTQKCGDYWLKILGGVGHCFAWHVQVNLGFYFNFEICGLYAL